MKKKLRFGVIGLGNMGVPHSRNIVKDRSREFSLGAVCDIVEDKARSLGEELSVPWFTDSDAMIASEFDITRRRQKE